GDQSRAQGAGFGVVGEGLLRPVHSDGDGGFRQHAVHGVGNGGGEGAAAGGQGDGRNGVVRHAGEGEDHLIQIDGAAAAVRGGGGVHLPADAQALQLRDIGEVHSDLLPP